MALTATTEPTDYLGVFNPVSYVFSYGADKVATFDTITDAGFATVKVSATMGALINPGDSVIIAGDNVLYYKGVQRVVSKTSIAGGVRVTLQTAYVGLSPQGFLVPNKKQVFDLWAGFIGTGATRLPWQKRDSILISPNLLTLDYDFEVQSFLKKYFDLASPIIGNDYNISLKYNVVGVGQTPVYANSKNGYYGFKNPTTTEIENLVPLGEYPINFIDGNGNQVPTLYSIINNEVGGILSFNNNKFESGLTGWTQEDESSFVIPVSSTSWTDATVGIDITVDALTNPGYTKIVTQSVTIGDIDTLQLSCITSALTGTGTVNVQAFCKFADDSGFIVFFPNDLVDVSADMFNSAAVSNSFVETLFPGKSIQDIVSIGLYLIGTISGRQFKIKQFDYNASSVIGSGDSSVQNVLSVNQSSVIFTPSYYFDAVTDSNYTITFQHSGAISSLGVSPALPSWIQILSSPSNQIKLSIRTNESAPGDYTAEDYNSVDYSVASFNNLAGCYQFQFSDGATVIFTLAFCIGAISETIKVCTEDVLNFAFLNKSGGYNSIALDCTYVNGRTFGNTAVFKDSNNVLKIGSVKDVYDTITVNCSVLSKRMLDFLMAMRSSNHVLLYNETSKAFDIPVVIEKSDLQTYGNKFNQAQTSQTFTLRKAKEVLIQTQ